MVYVHFVQWYKFFMLGIITVMLQLNSHGLLHMLTVQAVSGVELAFSL